MDSLYTDMGDPTHLLDGLIRTRQFSEWVDAHSENRDEKTLWEYYLQKVGAWDQRSFNDFKSDVYRHIPSDTPTDEQLTATIRKSAHITDNFSIQEGVGLFGSI